MAQSPRPEPAHEPRGVSADGPGGASPLVSVVIPTYKRADKIGPVLDSVLEQTLTDFEIVVVDDASGDATEDVVAAVADPRIRYVAHRRNLGGNAARRTGIDVSRGRYVAFLDSDDTWLPTKLEKQIALLREKGPEYGLCATWYRVQTPSGDVTRRQEFVVDGRAVPDLLVENVLGGYSSILVERETLERFGGPDANLKACQDWDLYLRLNAHVSVCVVPEHLVAYCQDLDDPVRISTRRDSVSSGLRHVYGLVRARRDELDPDRFERSVRTFLSAFANIGSPVDVARVARDVPRGRWNRGLARFAAHMEVRAVRKRLASRRARQ